jgi:predicted GTPase
VALGNAGPGKPGGGVFSSPGARRAAVEDATLNVDPARPVVDCPRPGPESAGRRYWCYLVNSLRESFTLPGVPIQLTPWEKANPYTGKGR